PALLELSSVPGRHSTQRLRRACQTPGQARVLATHSPRRPRLDFEAHSPLRTSLGVAVASAAIVSLGLDLDFTARAKSALQSEKKKQWQLYDEIGAGSFGTVRLGMCAGTGEVAAVKIVEPEQRNYAALQREIAALRLVKAVGGHRNIIDLQDVYVEGRKVCLVTELVRGGELFDHIIAYGAFDEHCASALTHDICQALHFLHRHGIVHKDIKPENILLSTREADHKTYSTVKLADFGSAGPPSNDNKADDIGTSAYLAPELLQAGMCTSSADMWSLGCVLYIMLSGAHPFDLEGTATDEEVEHRIKYGELSFDYGPWTTMSSEAKDLITKLMHKDPTMRPSASELGVSCKWIGVSTDPKTDPDAAFIHADLTKHGIDTSHCTVVKEGSMPISYILCSRATGSRTIVHWRNVPEMTYPDFSNQMMKIANLVTADPRRSFWFHFEGRDMDVVARMMQFARGLSVTIGDVSPAQLAASPSVPAFVLAPSAPVAKSISVEIEALRYTWEQAKRLIECAHYVFVSKDYIRQRLELPTAVSFYDFIQSDAERSCMSSQLRAIICPWGEEGVHYLDVTRGASSTRGHVSAELVSNVIESLEPPSASKKVLSSRQTQLLPGTQLCSNKKRSSGCRALDSAHRRTPLLLQMSISLVDTFNRCRAARDAALPAPPAPVAIPVAMPPQTRRVLTKKSEPAGNSGLDNEDRNLIVHVRDVLGVSDSHRGYLVLELLGQGTFGQVFRCQNLETKEMVAVKVIRNHPSYYKQAIVEVQITGLLNRKYTAEEGRHMVRLRDSFSYQSHLCLVFELLSINVYELIAENKFRGFPLSITRGLLEQMLHALVQFEDAGVIHCDLKPENILVAGRDEYFESPGHGVGQPHVPFIKIVDFGSACLENETVYSYIQSRFYRSPEVLLGIPYNSAIDMWSLGCIAFEMFLGLPLFPGVSEHDQLRLIEETLGCIPQRLVRRGRNVLKFYDVRADELNNSPYRREEFVLKTPEQFAKENNTEVKISKKYFKHDKLAEMIQAYPLDTTRTEEEQAQEQEQRRSFVHFVSCLLELDPQLRWTAREAVRHPFIAGTPFHPTRSTDAYAFQQEVGSPAAVMPFSPSVGGCSLEHLRSLHSSEVSKPGGLSVYSPARTGGEVGTNLDHSTAWGSGSQPLWGCALFDYRLPPHESSTQATKLLSSPYKHAALDVISQPYFSQAFHLVRHVFSTSNDRRISLTIICLIL
ncbi:TPA: hypothetical protein N0F65_002065, partial [Lagenidium giganteum]